MWERWFAVKNNVIAVLIFIPTMIKRIGNVFHFSLNRKDRGFGWVVGQLENVRQNQVAHIGLFYITLNIVLDLCMLASPPFKKLLNSSILQIQTEEINNKAK
jgi:hypothetical protein